MIKQLYYKGFEIKQKERAEESVKTAGTLRGGNSGCITDDGQVIGKCHRISLLRMLGYESSVEANTNLMFEAGYANEDSWLANLKKAWSGIIKCEEEIPIVWTTENNVQVTGRPDTVLCDSAGESQYLIEHKLICSPYSAYNKAAKGWADIGHLIQAAHYMWQLDVPGSLVYTSRVNYMVGYGGMKNNWQKHPEYLNDGQFQVVPFILEFELDFRGDVLYINSEVASPVTKSGIKKYYEQVAEMPKRKKLGPRPVTLLPDGSPHPKGKSPCDYCPLADVCDSYEGDYDRWMEESINLFERS